MRDDGEWERKEERKRLTVKQWHLMYYAITNHFCQEIDIFS